MILWFSILALTPAWMAASTLQHCGIMNPFDINIRSSMPLHVSPFGFGSAWLQRAWRRMTSVLRSCQARCVVTKVDTTCGSKVQDQAMGL